VYATALKQKYGYTAGDKKESASSAASDVGSSSAAGGIEWPDGR
jgi:hypothetical protein